MNRKSFQIVFIFLIVITIFLNPFIVLTDNKTSNFNINSAKSNKHVIQPEMNQINVTMIVPLLENSTPPPTA